MIDILESLNQAADRCVVGGQAWCNYQGGANEIERLRSGIADAKGLLIEAVYRHGNPKDPEVHKDDAVLHELFVAWAAQFSGGGTPTKNGHDSETAETGQPVSVARREPGH